MKKSKKIKLVTTLSTLATVATAVPTITIACTKDTITLNNKENNVSTLNAIAINLKNIKWVKQSTYDYSNKDQIVAQVKQENSAIFAVYAGLEAAIDIDATYQEESDNQITVTITNNKSNPKYTGATGTAEDPAITWNSKYVSPTPTPTPKPSKITKVTYSELKGYKQAQALVAGQQYEITDYEASVDTTGT